MFDHDFLVSTTCAFPSSAVCDNGYFMSSTGVCTQCPAGSTNTNPTADSCQCTGSTTTAAGSSTTTGEPCGGNSKDINYLLFR